MQLAVPCAENEDWPCSTGRGLVNPWRSIEETFALNIVFGTFLRRGGGGAFRISQRNERSSRNLVLSLLLHFDTQHLMTEGNMAWTHYGLAKLEG